MSRSFNHYLYTRNFQPVYDKGQFPNYAGNQKLLNPKSEWDSVCSIQICRAANIGRAVRHPTDRYIIFRGRCPLFIIRNRIAVWDDFQWMRDQRRIGAASITQPVIMI